MTTWGHVAPLLYYSYASANAHKRGNWYVCHNNCDAQTREGGRSIVLFILEALRFPNGRRLLQKSVPFPVCPFVKSRSEDEAEYAALLGYDGEKQK